MKVLNTRDIRIYWFEDNRIEQSIEGTPGDVTV
jgi:hypothetical protein